MITTSIAVFISFHMDSICSVNSSMGLSLNGSKDGGHIPLPTGGMDWPYDQIIPNQIQSTTILYCLIVLFIHIFKISYK